VAMTYPELRPPSFEVTELDDSRSLLLHYRSTRAGLAPMVIGLLKGLGKRFDESISVRQVAQHGVDDHDVFRIDYLETGRTPEQ